MHALAAPHLPRSAAGVAALRGLGVLLVLLGVLAMHAVSGGSHLTMAMTSAAPAAAPAGASSVAGQMSGLDAIPGPAEARPASRSAGWSGEHLGAAAVAAAGVTSGVGTACVAVLFGLLLLAARTAAVMAERETAPVRCGAGHGSAPRGRGPPRRLLAQLCVLRT